MTIPSDQVRADSVGRAIMLTLTTIGVFGIQDVVSKMLVQTYSPFMITMMRYWGFAAFALFMVLRQAPLGRRSIRECRVGKCCVASC